MDDRRVEWPLNFRAIHRRVVGPARLFRMYNRIVAECPRLRGGGNGRHAMVHGSALLRIRAGRLLMLPLSSYGRDVPLMCHRLLLRCGTGVDSAIATVIANTVDCCAVVDHGRVVYVVNIGDIHVVHRTVVVKLPILPAPTLISVTVVSIAITDAAVETNLLAPVAVVENISLAAPAP